MPQDVEWAIAHNLPFPDSVFFLQHRPETTWAGGTGPGSPGSGGTLPDAAPAPPQPAAEPAFDPVQYALRNVFKVPKK